MSQLPYTEFQDRSWQGDQEQWQQFLQDPNTETLVYWNRRALLQPTSEGMEVAWKAWGDIADRQLGSLIYLGENKGRHRLAAHITSTPEAETVIEPLQSEEWVKPRSAFLSLPPATASLLAYVEGMVYWRATNKYCGRCGTPTRPQAGGQLLICQNEQCHRPFYPRINPAVIMLIEAEHPDGEPACLLSRNFRTPDDMATTLAGFVELGETLEQAVVREVMEEAQVEVTEVSYLASQPWPFPSSLMLGFMGKAKYSEPIVDTNELRSARWYKASELRLLIEQGKLEPSRVDSIARHLITHWLDRV